MGWGVWCGCLVPVSVHGLDLQPSHNLEKFSCAVIALFADMGLQVQEGPLVIHELAHCGLAAVWRAAYATAPLGWPFE